MTRSLGVRHTSEPACKIIKNIDGSLVLVLKLSELLPSKVFEALDDLLTQYGIEQRSVLGEGPDASGHFYRQVLSKIERGMDLIVCVPPSRLKPTAFSLRFRWKDDEFYKSRDVDIPLLGLVHNHGDDDGVLKHNYHILCALGLSLIHI